LKLKALAVAAALAGSAAVLAACSGSGPSSTQPALPGNTAQNGLHGLASPARSGVVPQFLANLHFGTASPDRHRRRGKLKELAVSDFGSGAVELLNAKYQETGSITSGLSGPDGDWIDSSGNLYVANYAGVDVSEYNKAGSQIGTYSSGLGDPVDVTTDKHGNVYVADFGSFHASVVVEYAQGSNSPLNSCNTGYANEGVAVDSAGDVFVSGDNPNGGAALLEYKGGLSGCSATALGASISNAGGLQVDKQGDLVADDQLTAVDIIPAPYTTIKSQITTAPSNFHVALTERNNLLFIADVNDAEVFVDKYPSGTEVTVLNSANGLSDPAGVATYPFER